MDVHTVWVAMRGVTVAAALLMHGAAPLEPANPAAVPELHHGMSAEMLRQIPYPMSVDQVLAAMAR